MASVVSSTLCALPVGNPVDASIYPNGTYFGGSNCDPCDPHFQWSEQFNLRLGFYGDYVFNRHMETSTGHGIQQFSIATTAGLTDINICDWVDVFWTLGASKMDLFCNGGEFSSDSTMLGIGYEPYFSWSVGGRATIWSCGSCAIGIETQYFRTRPWINEIIRYASGDITYLHTKAVYEEWQVGIGIAYRLQRHTVAWIPYGAIKVSSGSLKMGNFSFVFQNTNVQYELTNLIPSQIVGYVLGTTVTVCDTIGVTVEGRFADEKALHINGQMRF